MATETLYGAVKWYDLRNGYGLIKDIGGTEFYVDVSSINDSNKELKHGMVVSFKVNPIITDILCATDVEVITEVKGL